MVLEEVRHPDGPDESVGVELLHRQPTLDEQAVARIRPVDEVQIDIIDSQVAAALFEGAESALVSLVGVAQLGREEELITRDPAETDRLTDASLVAVCGGRVDVAVTSCDGDLRRRSGLFWFDLVGPEPKLRNRDRVVQGNGWHGYHSFFRFAGGWEWVGYLLYLGMGPRSDSPTSSHAAIALAGRGPFARAATFSSSCSTRLAPKMIEPT